MANDMFNSFMNVPDEKGRFGQFGGRFVSETLMPLILDLEAEYEKAKIGEGQISTIQTLRFCGAIHLRQ